MYVVKIYHASNNYIIVVLIAKAYQVEHIFEYNDVQWYTGHNTDFQDFMCPRHIQKDHHV